MSSGKDPSTYAGTGVGWVRCRPGGRAHDPGSGGRSMLRSMVIGVGIRDRIIYRDTHRSHRFPRGTWSTSNA